MKTRVRARLSRRRRWVAGSLERPRCRQRHSSLPHPPAEPPTLCAHPAASAGAAARGPPRSRFSCGAVPLPRRGGGEAQAAKPGRRRPRSVAAPPPGPCVPCPARRAAWQLQMPERSEGRPAALTYGSWARGPVRVAAPSESPPDPSRRPLQRPQPGLDSRCLVIARIYCTSHAFQDRFVAAAPARRNRAA